MVKKFLIETWFLLNEMSPYLIFGFFIAGILKILIPKEKIYYHLSSSNFSSVLKASLIGIPLPLCSCGVIPVATHLDKEGSSRGATISFLISTPTTGIDSILATYSLLGPIFAIIRPISAFVSGIFAGTIVNMIEKDKKIKETYKKDFTCSFCEEENPHIHSKIEKIKVIFKYGFSELIEDVGKWIIIGILIGGLISTFVPKDFISKYLGNPFYSYSLMLLIGIPMYVCATGSIPIASSLISKGMTPGAGLVFLFTGPATNSATLTFVLGKLGKKNFLIYLFSIILWSVIFGIFIDFLWKFQGIPMVHIHKRRLLPYWFKILTSFLLLFLILKTFKFRKKIENTKEFEIPDIKCEHCVKTIESEFKKEGINVYVNLKNKKLYVPFDLEDKKVEMIVKKAGYNLKKGGQNG